MNTHLQRFYHLFWVLAGHQGFDTEAGCSRWPFNRFLGWGDPDQTPGFAVCRWFSQENQRILMNLKGICYYFLVPVPDQGQSKLCQAFVIFSKATGLLLNMSCHLVKSSKGLECMVQESIIVCLRRWIQMLFLYVGLQSWMVDFLMWTCGYLWKWSI